MSSVSVPLGQGLIKGWAALKGSELPFTGAQQRLARAFLREPCCHTGPVRMVCEASCGGKKRVFVLFCFGFQNPQGGLC